MNSDSLRSIIPALIDRLHSETLKAAGVHARDRREPGAKRKEAAEARLASIVRRVFRRQAAKLREWLEWEYPEANKADPPKRKKPPKLPDDFYDWDEDEQWDFILALQGAGVDGIALFAEEIGFGIDYTATNQQARTWARRYAGGLIRRINDTTRQTVRSAVESFVDTPGMTIGDVVRQLPFSQERALMIATTEITRAYAGAEMEAGRELQRKFPDVRVVKTWFTNNDDRVCPICGPLNGTTIDLEQPFPGGTEDEPLMCPPAHPNCRCWMQTRTDILGTAGNDKR